VCEEGGGGDDEAEAVAWDAVALWESARQVALSTHC
jgi:hypothetical protein